MHQALLAGLRFFAHKSSACQEKQMDFRGAQTKGSLQEGAGAGGLPRATEGDCVTIKSVQS